MPDNVAAALGANLVYTRFQGHGRDGDAMAEATASNWMNDAVEALAVARAVGDKVIILTTSTGGTIAALALHEPALQNDVAGVVFVSPNFGINNPAAGVLTLPAARYWVPLVAGETRKFDPLNDGQAAHWTTTYPTVATLPMAAAKMTCPRDKDLGRKAGTDAVCGPETAYNVKPIQQASTSARHACTVVPSPPPSLSRSRSSNTCRI